jgi:hypothetical protein
MKHIYHSTAISTRYTFRMHRKGVRAEPWTKFRRQVKHALLHHNKFFFHTNFFSPKFVHTETCNFN